MDLKEFLLDVFPNKDEEKYTKMIDNLKSLGLDSLSDLKYLDEEAVKELDSFSRIDIKKMRDYVANFEFEALEVILNEIFAGTPINRINEIKIFLNDHEIYVRRDVLVINIEEMRTKEFFSEIELKKVESYLEKKHLKHELTEILFGTPKNRLEEIEEILKKEEIYSAKDVLIADLNSLQLKESLSCAEMLKFEEYLKKKNMLHYEKLMSNRELEQSKNLKCVLKQIFVDTPDDRLEEIENILKQKGIHSGSVMKIIDTNDLRRENSLPDIEILKIEEYIKKHNRERYDEIKSFKMAEDERKFTKLKEDEEIKFLRLKGEEELRIIKLKAQEEQKMIEFKTGRENLSREEEKELKKAELKEEMERENMKMQREKELMEARTKDEMERENMKMQREKELIVAKAKKEMKREKMKMQREKELREEKAKEMEREIMKMQRDKELREEKAKEMERENMKMQREKELREEKAKEMERENMKMQRDQELREEKARETERENMKMQREKELREEKTKEMERENMKMQREKELREEKAKEMEREKMKMQNGLTVKCCDSLVNEKNDLLDDLRNLDKDCKQLLNVISENSRTGIKGFLTNNFSAKKKAEDEHEELKKFMKSKHCRLTEIDKLLNAMAGF